MYTYIYMYIHIYVCLLAQSYASGLNIIQLECGSVMLRSSCNATLMSKMCHHQTECMLCFSPMASLTLWRRFSHNSCNAALMSNMFIKLRDACYSFAQWLRSHNVRTIMHACCGLCPMASLTPMETPNSNNQTPWDNQKPNIREASHRIIVSCRATRAL